MSLLRLGYKDWDCHLIGTLCLLIGLHTLMKLDATQERLTWQGTEGDVQPKHSKDLRASL